MGDSALSAGSNRDLDMATADFDRIRALIYQRAGIALADHKTEMVYSRLAKRLRVLGLQRFKDYVALLQADETGPEWEHFTNALTTNLTAFFREAHHFPILADHVRRRSGPIRVWSCAASTGEEVYSIAIVLAETLGSGTYSTSVLGTDIDTRALAAAQQAIYPFSAVDNMAPERLRRFFQKGTGTRAGKVRVSATLRNMIEFRPLNLSGSNWGVDGQFDVIFCRNLMIYFDRETQARILNGFARVTKPGGLLFAGHSENFSGMTSAFNLRSKTVYERTAAAARKAI